MRFIGGKRAILPALGTDAQRDDHTAAILR
jgi:hypothetical protein